jgi:hypothetical protein
MRNRGRVNTRSGSVALGREKKPAPECDPSCSRPRFVEVNTTQIKMTDLDIRQVLLNERGSLNRCENCGRVREVYRDDHGYRQVRVIGEYDSYASPNSFTISQAVLDEYLMYCEKWAPPGAVRTRP